MFRIVSNHALFSLSGQAIYFKKNVFKGWISTILLSPSYEKNIDTIDDLVETKMPVFLQAAYINIVPKKLRSQYKFITYEGTKKHLSTQKPNGAYVLMEINLQKWFTRKAFGKQRALYHAVSYLLQLLPSGIC